MRAAFYCISSELYFPGAVALINSLRLVGHREPIYLLDCGLEPAHRRLLAHEATLVDAPSDVAPYLLKTVAPRAHPADVMVLIDVDMVATRSLAPLIDRAAEGAVVAVKDNMDRFVPEWGELLGLGAVSRRPYVTSGLVALGGEPGARVLELWDERQDRVDYGRSWFGRDEPGYPFAYLDQDVLNAVLCATLAEEELVVCDQSAAPVPPFHGLRLLDERGLAAADREGREPFVIHQFVRKPWVEPMYHSIYSRLLSRLWLGDDVALSLDPAEVPLRMRRGPAAWLARRSVDAWDLARWYATDVIPQRIRERRAQR